MNFMHRQTPEETHRLLLKYANGSIQIVHQALSDVAREADSRHISIQQVIDRIKKIQKKQNSNNKIPA